MNTDEFIKQFLFVFNLCWLALLIWVAVAEQYSLVLTTPKIIHMIGNTHTDQMYYLPSAYM